MHSYYILNGTVEFYPMTGTLSSLDNAEKQVEINSPASRCLLLLIQRKGSIVGQTEMMDEVWHKSGAHVTQNTYYQNISILRRGLKNAGIEEDIILTIPRIGVTLCENVSILTNPVSMREVVNNSVMTSTLAENEGMLPVRMVNNVSSAALIMGQRFEEKMVNLQQIKEQGCHLFRSPAAMAIMALCIGAIALSLNAVFFRHETLSYTNHYFLVGNINGCNVYYNDSIMAGAREDEIAKFLGLLSHDCKSHPYVYMSFYKTSSRSRISVIHCSNDIINARGCVSEYFIKEN